MERFKSIRIVGALVTLVIGTQTGIAQEYDDMYFTKKDRKKVSYDLKTVSDDSKQVLEEVNTNTYEETFASKEVNPEYIARYTAQSMDRTDSTATQNPTYGMADDTPDGYYTEESEESSSYYKPKTSKNYYTGNNSSSNYSSMGYGMGFNTWGATYSMVSMSFGNPYFGYNPYSFYNPYYSPYGYNPYYMTYMPGYGYGTMVFVPAYMYNTNYYCPSNYGSGYQSNDTNLSYSKVSRQTSNAPRSSAFVSTAPTDTETSRSSRVGNTAPGSRTVVGSSSTSRNVTSANYTESQNEYFKRSQSKVAAQAYTRTPVSPSTANRMSTLVPSNGRSTPAAFESPVRFQPSTTEQRTLTPSTRRYSTTEQSVPTSRRTPFYTPTPANSTPTRTTPTFSPGTRTNSFQPSRSPSFTPAPRSNPSSGFRPSSGSSGGSTGSTRSRSN